MKTGRTDKSLKALREALTSLPMDNGSYDDIERLK